MVSILYVLKFVGSAIVQDPKQKHRLLVRTLWGAGGNCAPHISTLSRTFLSRSLYGSAWDLGCLWGGMSAQLL
jgi:hypothetical protein